MKIKFVTRRSADHPSPNHGQFYFALKNICVNSIVSENLWCPAFCQNEQFTMTNVYLQWHYQRRLLKLQGVSRDAGICDVPKCCTPEVALGRKKSLRLFIMLREKGKNRVVLILHFTWQDNLHLKTVDVFFITDHLLLSLSSTTPYRILGTFLVSSIIYHSYSECLYLFIWRIIQQVEVGKAWTKMRTLSSGGISFAYSSTSPVGILCLRDDEGDKTYVNIGLSWFY